MKKTPSSSANNTYPVQFKGTESCTQKAQISNPIKFIPRDTCLASLICYWYTLTLHWDSLILGAVSDYRCWSTQKIKSIIIIFNRTVTHWSRSIKNPEGGVACYTVICVWPHTCQAGIMAWDLSVADRQNDFKNNNRLDHLFIL